MNDIEKAYLKAKRDVWTSKNLSETFMREANASQKEVDRLEKMVSSEVKDMEIWPISEEERA